MRLYVLRDSQKAGDAVLRAAIERGHSSAPGLGLADALYVRTCTFNPEQANGRALVAQAAACRIPSLPSPEEMALYDDKVAQVAALKPWLPRTEVFTDAQAAFGAINSFALPFISKAANGAASQNVRLIKTRAEAGREIALALQGAGIPLAKGGPRTKKPVTVQRGYLLWQEYIPGDGDVRVVINGDHAYGLRRRNRPDPDRPFASGSGDRSIIWQLSGDRTEDVEHRRAFHLADVIANERGWRWCCFDFVQTASRTFVLEVSFSWVEKAYVDCPLFRRGSWVPDRGNASIWATLAVEEIERRVR